MADAWIPPDQPQDEVPWTPPDTPDNQITPENVGNKASQFLAQYRQGDPSIPEQEGTFLEGITPLIGKEEQAASGQSTTERELAGISKIPGQVAEKAPGMIQGVKDWFSENVSKPIGALINPPSEAEQKATADQYLKEARENPEKAAQAAEDPYTTMLKEAPAASGKALAAMADIGAWGANVAAEMSLGPAGPLIAKHPLVQKLEASNNALADWFSHYVNRTANEYQKEVNVDPNSFAAQMTDLGAIMLSTPGLQIGHAGDVVKILEDAGELTAKANAKLAEGVLKAKPVVAGATKAVVGPGLAEGLRYFGVPIPHGTTDLIATLMGLKLPTGKFTDPIMNSIAAKMVDLSPEDVAEGLKAFRGSRLGIREALAGSLDDQISNLRLSGDSMKARLKPDPTGQFMFEEKTPDGKNWLHSDDSLPADQKKIRDVFNQADDLQRKADILRTNSQAGKVIDDIKKLGYNTAAQTLLASGVGAGFTGATSPTGAPDVGTGAVFGAMMGAPFAPFAAYHGIEGARFEEAQGALRKLGASVVDPKHLEGLSPTQADQVLKIAGLSSPMGVKVNIMDDAALRAKHNVPDGVNTPNGVYDKNTKTIDINRGTPGAIGHEIIHPTQELPQLLGQMVGDTDPALMKQFEDFYSKMNGGAEFDSEAERDAEVGRRLLQQVPVETFYGGEKGFDIIKKTLRDIMNRGGQPEVDPVLKAPMSHADLETMRQRMFKLGELAKQRMEGKAPPPELGGIPDVVPPAPGLQTIGAEGVPGAHEGGAPGVQGVPPEYQDAVNALKATGTKAADAKARVAATINDLQNEGKEVNMENVLKGSLQRGIPTVEEEPGTIPDLGAAEEPFRGRAGTYQLMPNTVTEPAIYTKDGYILKGPNAAEEGAAKGFDTYRATKGFVNDKGQFVPEHITTKDDQGNITYNPEELYHYSQQMMPGTEKKYLRSANLGEKRDEPYTVNQHQGHVDMTNEEHHDDIGYLIHQAYGEPLGFPAEHKPGAPSLAPGKVSLMPHAPETPAFKEWFGKSKIVDENGKALPVFHTSRSESDFDEFSPLFGHSLGFHFGGIDQANYVAGIYPGNYLPEAFAEPGTPKEFPRTYATTHEHYRQYPVFLKMENPVRASRDYGFTMPDEIATHLFKDGIISATERQNVNKRLGELYDKYPVNAETKNNFALRKKEGFDLIEGLLRDKGYDGIIYPNEFEGDIGQEKGTLKSGGSHYGDSYLVFDPRQIKSAIANQTFKPWEKQIQFMPSSNPDAIKEAAIRMKDGTIFTGVTHEDARTKAIRGSSADDWQKVEYGSDVGYVTGNGEFLDPKAAWERAKSLRQIDKKRYDENFDRGFFGDEAMGLESETFNRSRKFMPGVIEPHEVEGTNSRPVTQLAFQSLVDIGKRRLDALRADGHRTMEGFENPQRWNDALNRTYVQLQKPWGGATLNPETGADINLGPGRDEGPFSVSARDPGQNTIEIPIDAPQAVFNKAMNQAKTMYPQIAGKDHYLGVFRDDKKGTIDIDPVVIVDKRQDVDAIGAYTHAIGGAYDFSTGDGVFPPHVDDTAAKGRGRNLASGFWDSAIANGGQPLADLGESIGVPTDKYFSSQTPEAKQKILDHFRSTGQAQYMPASKILPDRFYVQPRIGQHDAIVDRLTGKVVDTWEGPDAGEYSSSPGYASAQEQADHANQDLPKLPPGWTGSHPDAFIPEIVGRYPDGTWGIHGKSGLEGRFETAGDANAALEEAHRQIYNPESSPRLENKKFMPGQKMWDQIAPFLDQEELSQVQDSYKKKVVDAFKQLKIEKGLKYAMGGESGKHWYTDAVDSIHQLFGSDIPERRTDPDRFAGLLAALSPNRAVSSDLTHALRFWAEWERLGRPQDRNTIEDLLARTNVNESGEASNLPAYVNNTMRVLTADDPSSVHLSGPKVDPFFANLRGDVNKVTNDRHMGFYGYGTPTVGKRSTTRAVQESEGGKRAIQAAKGLALTAHVRQIAQKLTEISGETWTPVEVQAAIWTYQLPLQDVAKAMGTTTKKLLAQGYDLPEKSLDKVPVISKLLQNETNQKALQSIRGRRQPNSGPASQPGEANRPQGRTTTPEISSAVPDISNPF